MCFTSFRIFIIHYFGCKLALASFIENYCCSRSFSKHWQKHSNTKAFENLMHLQHLDNKCSIIIKITPLVMNICNQGRICWDGGITKVIFCLTCIFLASSYHYICTSNWFLQISLSEPEKQSKSTKGHAGGGVIWIYHTESHTQQGEAALHNASLFAQCMHTAHDMLNN